IGNRDLQKMPRDALMTENWARIFDCGANVKILALGIVGRYEKESAAVCIVYARRVHEPAGAGRLEGFLKLADRKLSEVCRQRDKLAVTQKLNHFCFAAFVGAQKCFLVLRNRFTTRGIRIGE